MSQTLLTIFQNILQNSNIFNRSQETVLVMPFSNEKVTHFSGFPPTSVSYLESVAINKYLSQLFSYGERLKIK